MSSFLKLSRKDAFLEAVASQNVSDQILQIAVIEFLATSRPWSLARVVDLETDPQVAAMMDQVLPENLTLVEWLSRRMQQDIELEGKGNSAIVYTTARAKPLVKNAYYSLVTSSVRWARRNNAWTNKPTPYSESILLGSVLVLLRLAAKGRH